MKALQWNGKALELNDVASPQTKPGEALLRVTTAGICNTDLEITKGYFGFEGTLGHEFVAVVESGTEKWQGKRVVCDINCACRDCSVCESGGFHHCPSRTVIGIVNKDGAFAEYINAPEANLVEVPADVNDDKAVFTEPLAAALEIQEQVELAPGTECCVLGDGKLGLLIAASLAASGHAVTLVGRHPERQERLGSLSLEYVTERPKHPFPLVVEATGNPEGFQMAVDLTQPHGTLVLKSTYAGAFPFNPAMVVVNEINIVGSRCGPFPKAMELLASGKFDPSPFIDDRFSLEEGIKAIERASQKGTLKVLLSS